jgi:hypothetical protein
MTKSSLLYYFFIFTFVSTVSCVENHNRVRFTINPIDRKILCPVLLDDSIIGNLVFDTFGSFILDSLFCTVHPYLSFYNTDSKALQTCSGVFWTPYDIHTLKHDTLQAIKIGNSILEYNSITVYDLKRYMNNDTLDGVFNIPQNDTTHIWELNFEQNYLNVQSAENFVMPENCFLLPIVEYEYGDLSAGRNAIKVQFPMQIQCSDGDTLILNRTYIIDTGMPWDIAIMHKVEEQKFFNKRADAVWTEYPDNYYRHYTVRARLFDKLMIDSLRIYTFDMPTGIGDKCLIGTNFLKRFNVFFDMKNRQLGLQPIKNFQRIVNPNHRRFHFSTHKTQDGKFIVKKVADYKDNYYKTAGLLEYDEILAVNGKSYKDITYEEKQEFYKKDTLVYDIIRSGQLLKITVPVNKNEQQGD